MAFQGLDFRDLWRPGSGMTPRRLWVLLKAMPADAPFRLAVAEEMEKAQKPKPDTIRDRSAEWKRRNAERLAKEAG